MSLSDKIIRIDEKTQKRLKVYCAKEGFLMGKFADKLINEGLDLREIQTIKNIIFSKK